MNRAADSRAAYEKLAAIAGVSVAGAPAELVGRHAVADLSNSRPAAEALNKDLLGGRWRLTRGQFEFYWSEVARLSGVVSSPPAETMALTAAASLAWQERRRLPNAHQQETIWVGDQPLFLLWRTAGERQAVLISRPAAVFQHISAGKGIFYAAADPEGRMLAGRRGAGHATVRTAAESQIPWTLYVSAGPDSGVPGLFAQQRFLLLGVGVMVVFLMLGTYFIARAIRREIGGVAHAVGLRRPRFRTSSARRSPPCGSCRRSWRWAACPSEERRQLYYETLVRETTRLQRLVEALLNFGRMEAGARQYRFEEVDAAAWCSAWSAEFEPQIAGAGRHIELQGTPTRCPIEADPEAISVALRNLVDNALKYSPEQPTVWVEWGAGEASTSRSRVRDRGPGIAESEQQGDLPQILCAAARRRQPT